MSRLRLALLAALVSLPAFAVPAPWYKWYSPEAEHQVCAQFPPAAGWKIVKGPFEDPRCLKPGVPH